MKQILVTGATGQIGSELTMELRRIHGNSRVIAAGHRRPPSDELRESGPFIPLDTTDSNQVVKVFRENKIGSVYHLASILSAVAEENPLTAWRVNIEGLINILEVCRAYESSLFFPSSIGAFGPSTPLVNTPQVTIQRPATMYGITKTTGELLCDYYQIRYGTDTRGLRYPGLVSHKTPPGGGTTDYAVAIYYDALEHKKYECYLKAETRLDIMYMPDAIRAAIALMEADPSRLNFRNAYNVSAMAVTPEEVAASIRERIPGFIINYKIDPLRQSIAESWPDNMCDDAARKDWGWGEVYNLQAMTDDMLENIRIKNRNEGGRK